jgi:predicted pyridoxine 5'-phosphate oxidase superfamily flavin-nucleotide-binding protein
MLESHAYSSDIAFTPTVKALQERKGSRSAYHRMEERGAWQTAITPELETFLGTQISVFLATANAQGQPYIQHRGGPPGFLKVLDERTIAFADFVGNKQYITSGNLTENPKALLFLIDYQEQERIKIWGEAKVVANDPELLAKLMPHDYKARPEQVIVFHVAAWDVNCPQHIPQRFEAADVKAAIAERDQRIAELESEIQTLKSPLADRGAIR